MRLCYSIPVLACFAVCLAAHADTYQFSFGSAASTFSGSGLLTTGDAVAPGEFILSAISGTTRLVRSGPSLSIASLLDPGSFPTLSNGGSFPANDNVLFLLNGAGRPDENGFSFLLNGGAQINLFNGGTGVNALLLPENGSAVYEAAPLSITPTAPTPEPSTLALFLTGLLACASCLKRRFA